MRATASLTKILACALLGLPVIFACTRSSDRPANDRSPLVVPYAQATESDEEVAAVPERQSRSAEPSVREEDELDEPEDDLQVEVHQDGGAFSWSFRFSAQVSTDGGSIHVTISPDAGAP